jgi:hypothetical protein
MKRIFKKLSVLAVSVSFLFACASTTLKTVWMDEAYTGGTLKKVFVMGVSDKPSVKRFFEDEFVRELKARGTDAIASYTVIPDAKMNDKDYIASESRKLGIDAVLVTKLVDKKTVETRYPSEIRDTSLNYRGGWHGDTMRGSSTVTPGMVVQNTVVVLETNVYELNADKPIFSATSEAYLEDSPDPIIRSFVQRLIQELSQKKLVKP